MTAMEAIKKAYDEGYRSFGIRTIERSAEVGEQVDDSYDWDIENDCSTYVTTKEKLGGACAVEINDTNVNYFCFDFDETAELENAINSAKKDAGEYYGDGDTVMIIAGETSEYGNDSHEIIIPNAKCIYKF